MPFPWKSYMQGRLQDREIRNFMDFTIENAAYSAYGGMTLSSGPTGNYTLGAGWTKFTDFDLLSWANPRGVTIDLPNNRLAINVENAYIITIGFNMTHDESNSGRTTNFRLFSETAGIPGIALPISIGRNTPGTNFSISAALDIGPDEDDNYFSVELGGGDSVTGTFNAFQFTVFCVGPIQEQLD